METVTVPRADFAIIGGSGTYNLNFPELLDAKDIDMISTGLVFSTPFGDSPPFKLFLLGEKRVLTVKMHGWRDGVTRGRASQQLFWVLGQAGVSRIIAEGGVGSVNHLLKPRDVLVASDYLDFSMRKDVGLGGAYLLTMRQAVCPEIRAALIEAAGRMANGRVFDRGIYAVTDGRHFESPAEVAMLSRLGADMVGQSMCPEVYLAREIAACYARIDLVVNYAEGVVKDWEHSELKDIYYNESRNMAGMVIEAMRKVTPGCGCGCPEYRKPTLLKEKKN